MDKQELAKKPPMATPGFKTFTPKSEPDGQAETEYDKKIQEELERRVTDCCDGYSPHDYDRYGYKPRPKKPSQDSPAASDSKNTPTPEKKSNRRDGTETPKKEST